MEAEEDVQKLMRVVLDLWDVYQQLRLNNEFLRGAWGRVAHRFRQYRRLQRKSPWPVPLQVDGEAGAVLEPDHLYAQPQQHSLRERRPAMRLLNVAGSVRQRAVSPTPVGT